MSERAELSASDDTPPAPERGWSGRRRRSPPPEDPAWHERQRRVEHYRLRVEAGKGVFRGEPGRGRSGDELLAEERAEREGVIRG